MSKQKPLAELVAELHGTVPEWAKSARVSDGICYGALRGRLPQQPLLLESMARAVGLSVDAFESAVVACAHRKVKAT